MNSDSLHIRKPNKSTIAFFMSLRNLKEDKKSIVKQESEGKTFIKI